MAHTLGQWGQTIFAIARRSSIPAEFLGALVALESGNDPNARRFEVAVYEELLKTQNGERLRYGRLSTLDLQRRPDDFLRLMATSWGLTQVMGYHIFPGDPRSLLDPPTNLRCAVMLLTAFAARFHLDVRTEFEELLRCWNTGQPDHQTFDPNYVENGLRRLVIYRELAGSGGRSV